MDVACACLNVKVNLKTGPLLAGPGWSGVFYEGRSGMSDDIYQGVLDFGGILIEQQLLTRQVTVQSAAPFVARNGGKIYLKWKQIQCLNCGLWACSRLESWDESLAEYVPRNSVLLSSKVVRKDEWPNLISSQEYSPVFRFLILNNSPAPTKDLLVSGIFSGLDKQVDKFLRQEEVNSEERIRQVVEEEKKRMEGVKAKALDDRNRLLNSWHVTDITDSTAFMDSSFFHNASMLFESPPPKPSVGGSNSGVSADFTPPDTPKDASKQDDDDGRDINVDLDLGKMATDGGEERPDTLGPLPSPGSYVERGDLNLLRGSKNRRRASASGALTRFGTSYDAEGVFQLDGVDDGPDNGFAMAPTGVPLSSAGRRRALSSFSGAAMGPMDAKGGGRRLFQLDSDDDESETEGGGHSVVPDDVFERIAASLPIAHSLPVNVPMPSGFGQRKRLDPVDMDTDSDSPVPPENIAESIRLLARSVTAATDEEQFLMDLPRPRTRSFKDL